MKFEEKIVILRKQRGWSQEYLSNKLDVSLHTIIDLESGKNTPTMEEIKKLSKLYNISFDLLLDDEKTIEDGTKQNIAYANNQFKYRKVFNSQKKISQNHADMDNGYIKGNDNVEFSNFKLEFSKHESLLNNHCYSKTMYVQKDLLVSFFVNDKNKTIGFFFDGAEQFVCPFENFVDMKVSSFVSHSKCSINIDEKTAFNFQPFSYDIVITYFNENGEIKEYPLTFDCQREYVLYNGLVRNMKDMLDYENLLSSHTNKALNEMLSTLEAIKEVGKEIKNNNIVVDELNFSEHHQLVLKGEEERLVKIKILNEKVRENEKKKIKTRLMIGLLIIVPILVSLLLIYKANK